MASCAVGQNVRFAEKCECCKRTFALIKEFLKVVRNFSHEIHKFSISINIK